MPTLSYSLAGVPVAFHFAPEEAEWGIHLDDLLSRIFVLDRSQGLSGGLHIFHTPDAAAPAGKPLFESNGLEALQTSRGYQVRCGPCWMDLDLAEARGAACLGAAFRHLTPHRQRGFLQLAFLLATARFGAYALHAAALSRDGRGVLAFGDSGGGKTTLALAMLAQGWHCVSDDVVLLRRGESAIEAHAFGRGFSCTADTLSRHPGLHPIWPLREGKLLAGIDARFGENMRTLCRPALIARCEIAHVAHTEIRKIDSATAMAGLLRQSPAVLADRSIVAGQLGILRELCVQSQAVCLLLGRDVIEDPRRVSGLLEAELQNE